MSAEQARKLLDKWIDTYNMTDEDIKLLIKKLEKNWYGMEF